MRYCETPFTPYVKEKKEVKKEEKKAPVEKKVEKKVEVDPEEEEKKKKNPLDLLPETKFNLFDFKTMIVNATDKKEAFKFLWDNYDAEGFSFWEIKYDKAEGEGEKVFMTCNLMNGFL
jgi:elongation factor 1-gamma